MGHTAQDLVARQARSLNGAFDSVDSVDFGEVEVLSEDEDDVG